MADWFLQASVNGKREKDGGVAGDFRGDKASDKEEVFENKEPQKRERFFENRNIKAEVDILW